MILKKYRIGDLCEFVRGTYPTLKTLPGPYPLVVTAEFRRTADSWQLEGPAVCVPLISSTGHGDAALHRVHYQEGKFALANLLVALLPRDATLCDAKFLYHLFMTRRNELLVPLMLGTANVSLKERDIADIEISLPPLPKQQRIVARIEELAAKINEARGLRDRSREEIENLCRAVLNDDPDVRLIPISELVKLRPPDVTVQQNESYQFAGVYCFGRGVFRAQTKTGMEFAYTHLTRLKTGNFVYPKLMAWEGALGVVPPECDGCVVSTEFPVFEVLEDRVLPEVLDTYFRSPNVWPALSGSSTGTNVRRRRLNPSDFLNYRMPLPSRATQERLRRVRVQMDVLKKLQAETAAELDALLPSILDKAFKGEL